ncbi:MAG: PEP-CTERM sorting domain-containing protein [Pseudomonadota bacterium]
MKSMRSLFAATLFATALPALAVIPNVTDQESSERNNLIATFGQSGLAQSFKQLADNVSGAGFYLFSSPDESDVVTIELWSKLPNQGGSLLAGGTASGVSAGWVDVFWTPVTVTPGATYFLVFSGPSALGLAGSTLNPYPDGQTFASSGYVGFPNFDYAFRTFAAAVPEPAAWASMMGGLGLLSLLAAARRRA